LFDHVMIDVAERDRSLASYTAVLKVIGIGMQVDEGPFIAFGPEGRHILWLRHALSVGGRSNGKPGIRGEIGPNYYAAYVLDPDGNNIEAVCYKEA
jgi:catechol 2,3-dioxygenase-like lactoylglutathione lyase family enzyme